MKRVRVCLFKPLDDLLVSYATLPSCNAKVQPAGLYAHAMYKDELLPDKCSTPPRNYFKRNLTQYLGNMANEVIKCSQPCCEKMPDQSLDKVRASVKEAARKVCLKCFKEAKHKSAVGKCQHDSSN